MASCIFAILDDIAVLLDDVAVMSKIAAKKTAGILGDDLAVNAEKASGFASSRELPVLWNITKGSLLNKLIILLSLIPLVKYSYSQNNKLNTITVEGKSQKSIKPDLCFISMTFEKTDTSLKRSMDGLNKNIKTPKTKSDARIKTINNS